MSNDNPCIVIVSPDFLYLPVLPQIFGRTALFVMPLLVFNRDRASFRAGVRRVVRASLVSPQVDDDIQSWSSSETDAPSVWVSEVPRLQEPGGTVAPLVHLNADAGGGAEQRCGRADHVKGFSRIIHQI